MVQKSARVEWIKRTAFDRPVIFCLLVLLVAGLLTEIPLDALLSPLVGDPGAEFLQVIIEHTLTGLILLWLIVKLGLLADARLTPPKQWKAVWLGWPLVIMTLLNLDSLIDGSLVIDTSRPGLFVLLVLLALSIGFCEEVMGRGLVLSVMLRTWEKTRRGIYKAVLVSSALFGASYVFNLLVGRLPPIANLTQILYSLCFGVLFAACFLRNNSIWPIIILHAAIDFAGGLRHLAVGAESHTAVANNTLASASFPCLCCCTVCLFSGRWLRLGTRTNPWSRWQGKSCGLQVEKL